jgi:hypothetical protein
VKAVCDFAKGANAVLQSPAGINDAENRKFTQRPTISNKKSACVQYSCVCQQLLIPGWRSCSQGAAGSADGIHMVFYSLPLNKKSGGTNSAG